VGGEGGRTSPDPDVVKGSCPDAEGGSAQGFIFRDRDVCFGQEFLDEGDDFLFVGGECIPHRLILNRSQPIAQQKSFPLTRSLTDGGEGGFGT
jgi:hypothetical protein